MLTYVPGKKGTRPAKKGHALSCRYGKQGTHPAKKGESLLCRGVSPVCKGVPPVCRGDELEAACGRTTGHGFLAEPPQQVIAGRYLHATIEAKGNDDIAAHERPQRSAVSALQQL